MFCSKCGTELLDDSQFCRKCGFAFGAPAVTLGGMPVGAAPARALEPEKEANHKWVWLPFVILGVLILALLLYGKILNESESGRPNPIQQLIASPRRIHISNPAVAVSASGAYYYTVNVPSYASNVTLEGTFSASGGSGNDIEVYVLSQDEFVNWQNGHPVNTYYNSGRVTVGNISTRLPSGMGTYYLVFNNKFSLLSQKMVQVNAVVTYYQ